MLVALIKITRLEFDSLTNWHLSRHRHTLCPFSNRCYMCTEIFKDETFVERDRECCPCSKYGRDICDKIANKIIDHFLTNYGGKYEEEDARIGKVPD